MKTDPWFPRRGMEETQRVRFWEEWEFSHGSGGNMWGFFNKGGPKLQGRALVE